jgi:hypothetical protein
MESDSSPLASAHDETADLATSKPDNKLRVASPSGVTPEMQNTELHYNTSYGSLSLNKQQEIHDCISYRASYLYLIKSVCYICLPTKPTVVFVL